MSTDDVTPDGRDEFDVDLVPGQRRGAHRTQSPPIVVALLAVFVVLLIASLIISIVAIIGLPGARREAAPPPSVTTTAQTPLQTAEPIQPEIDKGASLTVLNGTRVSGVTRRVRDELKQDGWIVDRTANNSDRSMPTTVVQYADPSLEQTANALKDKLRGGVIQQVPPDDLEGADLRVIVGETYAVERGLIRRPSPSSTSPTSTSPTSEETSSAPSQDRSESPSSTRSPSRSSD